MRSRNNVVKLSPRIDRRSRATIDALYRIGLSVYWDIGRMTIGRSLMIMCKFSFFSTGKWVNFRIALSWSHMQS